MKHSFVELRARDRAKAILDRGTFRELLGPFDKVESPHLPLQDIVPSSDDGMIIAKGLIDGAPAVVISIEGAFQGGGIGEVAGAKFAGALELGLCDNKNGIPTRPVVIFDTGGVRLQEANYGLLAISEIQSAIVALREYIPVVGVVPGKIGCFGGMSMTAGLFSTIIITKEGRITLNGPEVIEQEAGVEEFDAKDKQLIWNTVGGAQRCAIGLADVLVEDDSQQIRDSVVMAFLEKRNNAPRSRQVDLYYDRIKAIDPQKNINPQDLRQMWSVKNSCTNGNKNDLHKGAAEKKSRGHIWFDRFTGEGFFDVCDTPSVLCKNGVLNGETITYIAVVPDSNNRFTRVRNGEVGVEEGWAIAKYIRAVIELDKNQEKKRPIIAIVDVPSQAYGYKEELLGIFQSCAAAVDAYATARLLGHPVISLVVGNAISGAFLAHGYQANCIIALDDPGVLVHAMSKKSAARVTKRSVEELEEAAKKVPSIAYDVRSYATLGCIHELICGIHADAPQDRDIQIIQKSLLKAIADAREMPNDLSNRLTSEVAAIGRKASIKVRAFLKAQWN